MEKERRKNRKDERSDWTKRGDRKTKTKGGLSEMCYLEEDLYILLVSSPLIKIN
jgi:hypothetical protein